MDAIILRYTCASFVCYIFNSPVHRFSKLIKKPPLKKKVVYSILPKKADICSVGSNADIHSDMLRAQ